MASTKNNEDRDKFVDLVTATAEVTLPLGEFHPRSMLVTAEHHIERARFPVIDYHNHLDSVEPEDALRVMDACGVEKIVNITMKTGDAALRMIDKFAAADPQRFATIELQAFILDAYTLVRAKLTKKLQAELGPLPTLKADKQ